jgi:hypothetical protein
LNTLVSSLSIFDVTTAYDGVYALLAVTKNTIPSTDDENERLVLDHAQEALEGFTQKKRYKVDYTQPFSDVCKEFVQFCIDHSDPTRALDIICRPWAPEAHKSALKRITRSTKKITSVAASGPSENGRLSSENTDRNGPKESKESKDQEQPKAKPPQRKQVKDHGPLPSWIPSAHGCGLCYVTAGWCSRVKMGRKNADTLVGLPSSS